jgi:purine-binding chemotaxis protein CheW
MPRFIEGAVEYRGIMVPIINLNSRFGFGETEYTKKTKILITKVSEILLGFIVNDVPGIFKLSEREFEPAPDIIRQAGNVYLKNVAKINDNLVSVLDMGLILQDKELKKLEILENKMSNEIN